MKIISHRGGAKLAPENSLKALKISKSLRVDGVELDVRVTKDNQLAVFHDATLMRLAGKRQKIRDLNLAELQKITLKNGAKIPSLDEYIAAAGIMHLYIEGKGDGWAALVSKAIKAMSKDNVSVISFNHEELAKFKKQSPGIETTALSLKSIDAFKVAKKYGFSGASVFYLAMLNPYLYKEFKRSDLKLGLFTVNKVWIFKILSKLFPDASITTDAPDKLRKPQKALR